MKFPKNLKIGAALVTLTGLLLLSSCSNYNKILYLKDIPDSLTTGVSTKLATYQDPLIQTDDILSITILTVDPTTATIINQEQAALATTTSSQQQPVVGNLVDKDGNVSLPIIGTVKVAGLTTSQARDLISQKASVFYKEPNVQVRFANFKVTVLGEVAHPSTYILPSEKNTIFDALGLAGDVTIYGKKDNIMLVRDSLGTKISVRLNLNSTKALKSPYFYLRQNDLIIVEPTKDKLVASNATQTRLITIGVTFLSAIALILIRFK